MGARIKDLASRCNFGAKLEVVLRDVFVVGMGSGKIQDRLLEDDASSLSMTLTKSMEVATNKEATINASKVWFTKEISTPVNFTRLKDSKAQTKHRDSNQGKRGNYSQDNGKSKC